VAADILLSAAPESSDGISHCQQSMRRWHYMNTKLGSERVELMDIKRIAIYGVLVLTTVKAYKEPEEH
jgi:hypothetical protein